MRRTLDRLADRISHTREDREQVNHGGSHETVAIRERSTIGRDLVDALSTLLMAIMFLLTVFAVGASSSSREVFGRDEVLNRLNSQINELTRGIGARKERQAGFEDLVANLQASLVGRGRPLASAGAARRRFRQQSGRATTGGHATQQPDEQKQASVSRF